MLVEHIGPFREGEHIFREGDDFNAIAAVRGGTVKTYVIDTITVKGLKTFSNQTVVSYSGLRKGQKVSIPGDEISAVIS